MDDAVAESARNPVSEHPIQSGCRYWSGWRGMGRPGPSHEAEFLDAYGIGKSLCTFVWHLDPFPCDTAHLYGFRGVWWSECYTTVNGIRKYSTRCNYSIIEQPALWTINPGTRTNLSDIPTTSCIAHLDCTVPTVLLINSTSGWEKRGAQTLVHIY